MVAVINTTLMEWDSQASHPWMLTATINFDDRANQGMPDKETCQLLDKFEDGINSTLKDSDGFLNLGRQTGDNSREIYLACKTFRKPSKVLHEMIKNKTGNFAITYDLYKDKYWRSLERFKVQ